MNRLLASLCLGGLASVCVLAQPKLIRVPQDQPTIQAGINAAANGDTVLVAEGTYTENLLLNKKIVLGSRFILDRDRAHISKTIIDGSGSTNPDRGSTITLGAATDTTLHIIGFTIRGGTGNRQPFDGVPHVLGGGIQSSAGGSAHITHNIVTANHLVPKKGDITMSGGGMSFVCWPPLPYSFAIIDSNIISGNTLKGPYAEAGGIGISYLNARIEGNVIENNTVYGDSGYGGSGGIMLSPANALLSGNFIRNNSAGSKLGWGGGGGIAFVNGGDFTMHNNIVADNVTNGGGGAIAVASYEPLSLIMINNTIVADTLGIGGSASALHIQGPAPILRAMNNIFWAPDSQGLFYFEYEYFGGRPYFHNNLFWPDVRQARGTNAVFADPSFVRHTDQFYIHDGPARNAGLTYASVAYLSLSAPTTDFRGRARDATPDLGAHEFDATVGVEKVAGGANPVIFLLFQNYPNPFNPATTIDYELPSQGHVVLKVYDLLGQEVAVLVDEFQTAGYKSVSFDASGLSSGMYLYRLSAGELATTKKLVVLR